MKQYAGLCPQYIEGDCKRSDRCTFIHDTELRTTPKEQAEAAKLMKLEKKRINGLRLGKKEYESSSSDSESNDEDAVSKDSGFEDSDSDKVDSDEGAGIGADMKKKTSKPKKLKKIVRKKDDGNTNTPLEVVEEDKTPVSAEKSIERQESAENLL